MNEQSEKNEKMEHPIEPALYSEAQLRELLQTEGDRRVTSALRRREREFEAKLEERAAEAARAAEETFAEERERIRAENDTLRAGLAAAERENRLRQNSLDAVGYLTEHGVPQSLSAFAVTDDADETLARAKTLVSAFKAAVGETVSGYMARRRPLPAISSTAGVTREQFRKMTLDERQKLRNTDPDAYEKLANL